jgi:hypothetical protein
MVEENFLYIVGDNNYTPKKMMQLIPPQLLQLESL